jgi:L-2-hydroxyglutarate oxidase LhgO
MNTNVSDLSQKNDKDRALTLHDTKLNTIQNITTKFVFIGA